MTTRHATALVAAAVMALSSCKRDDAGSAPGAQRQRTTSPAIAELLAAVPGNAAALAFIDMDDAPWSLITGGVLVPLDETTRKDLDKELRDYVDRYLGLDLSKVQYAVGFVSGPPVRGALLVKTVSGTLKMPGARNHEGGSMWLVDPRQNLSLAIKDGVIVFGETTAAGEVLETMAGKRKPVTVENKPLTEWLRKQSDGAAFALAAVKPKDVPLPPPLGGIERVALSLGLNGGAAVVEGDDATISSLQAMSNRAFAMMLAEVEKQHAAATSGKLSPPEGAGAIIAAAYARSFVARLKPQRTGNRLSASLDLGGGSTGAALALPAIGILSAVAIPAFMDYTKRSKKSEAALQLNKIAKNAKRAYSETSSYPPGSAPLTPPAPCCGQPNNHCAAVPERYAADPVWQALDFQIDEPTLFQYSYSATADGQRFVAKAVGDLDCDGISITYEMVGTVANGNPTVTLVEPDLNAD